MYINSSSDNKFLPSLNISRTYHDSKEQYEPIVWLVSALIFYQGFCRFLRNQFLPEFLSQFQSKIVCMHTDLMHCFTQ